MSAPRQPASWSASQLLQRFAVWGRFYERRVDGRDHALRSHLEVFEHDLPWEQVRDGVPDLVAVMMNPGGSRPLAAADAQGWAPAVPDRTQYQLMKLALSAQATALPIRHVRVINLSDLRTPKSAQLFEALATIGGWHSIFDPARGAELEQALGSPQTPVLRAWGLSPHLRPLADAALHALAGRSLLGLSDNGRAFRHPLPQRADLQRDWLDRMAAQWAQHAQS